MNPKVDIWKLVDSQREVEKLRFQLEQVTAERDAAQRQAARLVRELSDLRSRNVTPLARPVGGKSLSYKVTPEDAA